MNRQETGAVANGSNEQIVAPHDLLARLARTLRGDIGPAVGDTFARTQAFMAAVILEKLSTQLANAETDASASAAERASLVASLPGLVGAEAPAPVVAAIAAFDADRSDAALSTVIRALYAGRSELGDERFAAALGAVRTALRAGLDRRLVVAR